MVTSFEKASKNAILLFPYLIVDCLVDDFLDSIL